jgi:hypothetical protein
MKTLESYILFGLATALGVCTSILYWNAGYGAAGVLILGAIISTATFSLLGGRLRVWLATISVLPPFVVSSLDNISGSVRSSFWDALWDTLPIISLAFGLLVALPLTIVSIVLYFIYRSRSSPTA